MAEFLPAVALTLKHEGGFFHNHVTGEVVNFGITLRFVKDSGYFPAADVAYIQNLTVDEARKIYQKYFWDHYGLGQIQDQALANKAFDLTVNMGAGGKAHPGALTMLQQAVVDCGGQCEVDGSLGPKSFAAINALDAGQLLTAYRARVANRYQTIADANVGLTNNLPGWLSRLESA